MDIYKIFALTQGNQIQKVKIVTNSLLVEEIGI